MEPGTKHIFLTVSLVIMQVFAIFGNTLLFLVVYRRPRLRTRTNIFILNLAAADMGVAITCMPFSFVTCLKRKWIFGDVLCHMNGFFNIVFGMGSLLTLTAISVEKYCAIVKPLHMIITRRRAIIMLLVTWFEPVLFASLPLTGFTRYVYKEDNTQCSVQDPVSLVQTVHAIIVFFVAYVIPLSIMGFAYVGIFKAAGQHNRRVSLSSTSGGDTAALSKQTQIAITVFVMLIVFILCWTPYFVYVIYLTANHRQDAISRDLVLAAYWCVFLNSALNPYIYGIRNPALRAEFMKVLSLLLTTLSDWFRIMNNTGSVTSFSVVQGHSATINESSVSVAKAASLLRTNDLRNSYHSNDGCINEGDVAKDPSLQKTNIDHKASYYNNATCNVDVAKTSSLLGTINNCYSNDSYDDDENSSSTSDETEKTKGCISEV